MWVHCRNCLAVALVAVLGPGCGDSTPEPPPQASAAQQKLIERLDRIETEVQQLLILKRLASIEEALQRLGGKLSDTALAATAQPSPATAPALLSEPETAPSSPVVATAEEPSILEKPSLAAQPVKTLLLGLGVKPSLVNASSNWCECLEEVAGDRKTAGDYVILDGERFPALAALPPPPIPPDNPQTLDEHGFPRMDDPKVELGKLLFFDGRLSGDNSVSCATCHEPDQGWGLNSAISRGYPGTSHWRNSHTVVNSAYMWKLFWDGSQNALEPQAKSANTGLSGNAKTDMSEERLRQVPEYVRMFKEVFGTEFPLLEDSWRAIGAFQRGLVQPDTPFDLYMKGDTEALDEQQISGLALFQGKAGCIRCHNGPMFTDQKYYNNGIPQQESFLEDPIQQITHRFQYYSKGVTEEVYRKGKIDLGLYFVSKRKQDIGKFRVQTLRYLTYTPPYMHNGVFDDLEEVVEFYNQGGGTDLTEATFGIANKTKRLKPLGLTDEEKEALVAFLDSLSGEEMLMDNPTLPDPMAVVYRGETYVGLPIPVVTSDPKTGEKIEVEAVTWLLVSGPEGVTIDPVTGRVTWRDAQPPPEAETTGKDIPIAITIRSTTAKGVTTDETLQVTVLRSQPPALASLRRAL